MKEQLLAELAELKKWLPYADGGAYHQDLKRIHEIEEKLRRL